MKAPYAVIWLPALLASLGACAQMRTDHEGGSLEQGLQVSADATLSSASYTIEGPNGFASAGTVPVGDSPDVPVPLSHLPVGQAYEVALNATASDGVTVCEGSSSFDVVDSTAEFTVVVHLDCAVPSGDASIQATLNVCPVVDGMDASPMDLKLGGVSRLTLLAHDSDNGPSPLSYSWAVNGIKLTRQTSQSLGFACSALGEVTISGTASDGDPDPLCADKTAVKVTCQ